MNSIQWKMLNCECIIAYDYDPVLGDTVKNRVNHRHISRCPFHPTLEKDALHDALCLEQTQVAIAQKKIAEVHPELKKEETIDLEKVVVGLDDKRDIVCVVIGLTDPEMADLKTTLESVCDRPVKVI